jgi:hypothetical protein
MDHEHDQEQEQEQEQGWGRDRAWVPAFEGQRPPFQPGHELTLRHGAYSPRKVDPLARELVEGLLGDESLGFLKAPSYRPALWAWARAEAQVQLLSEYLEGRATAAGNAVGDLRADDVRSAYLLLHRAESRADRSRARLGLDPLSRARLGKDVAQGAVASADVARLMGELARLEGEGRLPSSAGGDGS